MFFYPTKTSCIQRTLKTSFFREKKLLTFFIAPVLSAVFCCDPSLAGLLDQPNQKDSSEIFDDLFQQGGSSRIHSEEEHEWGPPIFENHPRYRQVLIDINHFDVNLTVDPVSSELEGQAIIYFTSKAQDLKTITLDANSLEIIDVLTLSKNSISEQEISLPYKLSRNTLELTLNHSLNRNEKSSVKIKYRSKRPQSIFLSGPDTTHPTRQRAAYTYTQPEDTSKWLPCIDRPDDKATATIKIHLPKGYRALSNGLLTEETVTSMTYDMSEPIAPYLMSLVIGPYEITAIGSFRGKPLTLWSPSSLMPLALFETQNTISMMETFSDFTGVVYPFTHYAQAVAESHGGSMEHQTATTMGGTRITGDGSGEVVVAHELAHQWFGDWVTCRSWGELWLNEGFASYLPYVFFEKKADSLQLIGQMDSWRKNYFREAQKSPRALSESHPHIEAIFDSHSYDKGALIIHMIRTLVEQARQGNDQRGFTDVLKKYLSSRARENVTYHDLQKALENTTETSWQIFFEQWVLSPGHPQLRVRYDVNATNLDIRKNHQKTPSNSLSEHSEIVISIDQVQMDAKSWRAFTFPLEIEIFYENSPSEIKTVQIFDQLTLLKLPIKSGFKGINLNPQWKIPLEYELEQSPIRWQHILLNSPYATSRLEALRKLNNHGIFEGIQFETEGKKIITDVMNDPEPYIKLQLLQILLQKLDNKEFLPPYEISLFSTIRQVIDTLRSDHPKPYQIRTALMRAEERLLLLQDPASISEAFWQEAYLLAPTVGEREAILGILSHISSENTGNFILQRFQENRWSSQDRLNMVTRLTRIADLLSFKILGSILRSTPSTLYSRVILNSALKDQWIQRSLIQSALSLIANHTKDYERTLSLRWLALQTQSSLEICPTLLAMSHHQERFHLEKILVNFHETIQKLGCNESLPAPQLPINQALRSDPKIFNNLMIIPECLSTAPCG